MSTAGPAAGWPLVASLPSIPSKPRYLGDDWVALYGMLECLWADGLLRLVCLASTHIYTGIQSLLVRESQRGTESVGV